MSEQEKKQNTVAEVLVKCLENEGVKYVFGIPGEENLDMMNALEKSDIRVIVGPDMLLRPSAVLALNILSTSR